MTLFLRMGVFIFLVANYGLQVGGTKDPNEKEAKKEAQSMVAPQATDKVTGQDTSKGDKISKQTGKDDSIGEQEEHINSDSSHEKDAGRISPKENHIDDTKSEKAAKIKNQGDSKKRTKEDTEGTEGNGIETGVQTTNNNKKQEKKPGIMKRVSSKLPFRKSDKKVNPPTNTGNEDSSKVTGIKDSTAGSSSSSSESDGTKQKTKVGISDSEKDIGKKLDENNPKGAGMGKDQTNEGSSSNESEGSKKKSNPEGKTSRKKYEAAGLKDKDSSSESGNDEENKSNKKAGQVKSPKTGPSKDSLSSNTENKTIDKDSGDENANTPQAVDQPQGEKKPGMLGKLIRRPHLPGPNIARFLSRKNNQQAA